MSTKKKKQRIYCSGKRRFETNAEALEALSVSVKVAVILGRRLPVRVYPCSQCKGFHMTSKTEKSYNEQVG